MKYLKTIGYEITLIILFTLIYSILYYFNITSSSVNNVIKIISFIFIFILTGINIGKLSSKKGWLEGLKISLITIILFIFVSLLFKYNFNIKQVIYYLITSITIVLGSMMGINFRKKA